MVSAAPIPLSPRELELLAAFIAVDFDLQALIAEFSLSPSDTLDFLESEPIRARLQSIKRFTDLADHLFNSRQRRAAISALSAILSITTDPIERRRAATAILRFTSPTTRRSGAAAPRSTDADPSPSSLRRSIPSSPAPPSSPSPAPLRADASPESVSLAITDAIARDEASTAFSIIRETLAPDATLNGEPMPADPQAFSPRCADHSPIAPLADTVGLIPIGRIGDDRHVQEELIAVLPDGRTFTLALTYRRASPSRWQVSAVQMHPIRHAEPANALPHLPIREAG